MSMAAITTRMVRGSLLEIGAQPFMHTARCKGLSESVVMWRHALPNALPPIFVVMAVDLAVVIMLILHETRKAGPAVSPQQAINLVNAEQT